MRVLGGTLVLNFLLADFGLNDLSLPNPWMGWIECDVGCIVAGTRHSKQNPASRYAKGESMLSPKRFVVLLWLALSMALAACDNAGPKITQLKFEGTVTDAATVSPIAGATVRVSDFSGSFALVGRTLQSTVTDSQGRYTLSYSGCAQDPYLVATAADYDWADQEVSCTEDVQVLDFALNRTP